ncbi:MULTISPECIES: LPS export ABC transporter permease LptF [Aliagarivorans]|uniref:LPS export ABC transporter permease LptF n=1 Tax=Aliagarivorans TaxID=882379 RepID=UPI0004149BE8|nr:MULTISPECIES: LPS export ABC transporter permease LptF [Aliagarivorans]
MLVFRYLFRETFKTQIAVLAILLLIFSSQKFVRILGQAADGSIPGNIIAQLMLFNMPSFLVLILPISLFIGVLLAHGRLYAESEMVVLQACGYSTSQLLRDTMVLGLISMAFSAANTLYVSPYTQELEQRLFDQVKAEAGLATLVPGRFTSLGGGAVTFVEQITNKGRQLEKVFVAHSPDDEDARASIVMASKGEIEEHDDGSLWLVLRDGKRFEQAPEHLDHSVLHFEEYQAHISERGDVQTQRRLRALPTEQLLANREDLRTEAELQWRIGLPLSVPILVMLVVPLAAVNPRQGRYAKLLPAILLYLSYYLLLSAARSALEDGKLPPQIGLWAVHGLMFTIGSVYLFLRSEWFLIGRQWLKGK